MAIRVDWLQPCIPNRRWRWDEACHLFSDDGDLEALHAFAEELGLKRAWFQDHPRLPHYDLTAGKRKQALKLGAVEISKAEMCVLFMRRKGREP